MKQKFVIAKPRPLYDPSLAQYYGYSKRSFSEQSYRYMNMVNSAMTITALRQSRYGAGAGFIPATSYGFQTNYPISNIYSSLHIHKECKTDGNTLIYDGIYDSGISLTIPNPVADGLNGTDTFNTVVLHFNVLDANVYSSAKFICVGFRKMSDNSIVAGFKFRLWDYMDFVDGWGGNDEMDGEFLETSKWNKNSGVLRIDKAHFVEYNQRANGAGVEAWEDFMNLQNVYMDVWFQSGNALDTGPGMDFSDMRFSISNITVGQAYEVQIDEGLDQSIDDLSVKTKNTKTGTTFIEKNSFVKKLKFKISLFTDEQINDFIKNISLGCLTTPVYFFPGTEIREGKLPFIGSPESIEPMAPYVLDGLWGGLYLMSEPKIANSQFDVHGTTIDLDEYK